MPFKKIDSSEANLKKIGLPKGYKGSSLYINKKAKAYLLFRSYYKYRDICEEIFLSVDDTHHVIERRTKFPIKGKPKDRFIVKLQVAVNNSLRARIVRLANQSLSTLLGTSVKVAIHECLAPMKPRSITKIKRILSNIAPYYDKESIMNDHLKMAIPIAISQEEAEIFHEHLRTTNGKGVLKEHMLLFELLYFKYKLSTST